MPKPILSQSYLISRFYYLDGSLFHRKKDSSLHYATSWNNRLAGKTAGTPHRGYINICLSIEGKNCVYREHRLIFSMIHGYMPKEIDHIDGNRSNNCISNLRDVSHAENGKNQRMDKRNTSGFNGVSFCKDRQKWKAQITVNFKVMVLGRFKTKEEAIEARKAANIKYGFHPNHGRP